LLVLDQEDHIKFGKTLHRYEFTTSGVKVFFDDGTTEEGTLLVGADGVASRVRKQFLPNQGYVDTGSCVIYGKTPITAELTAAFPAEAMQWTTILRDEKPLILYLEPIRFPENASVESAGRLARTDDYVYWVFGGSAEHFDISDEEFHSLSGKAAADLILKVTEQWEPGFRALFHFQNTENTSPLRLISAKPERPDWAPSARVTLLGDAVHAMMPTGGSGANAALRDAALLTKLIVQQGISEDMMQIYIDQLWEGALPLISGSAMAGEKLLGFKGFSQAKEIEL
jgi:2-polyprenyl-6-methoxyphenol hydroxylase-like FAD-dependent oxidoreductase